MRSEGLGSRKKSGVSIDDNRQTTPRKVWVSFVRLCILTKHLIKKRLL